MATLSDIIERNRYTPERVPALEDKLFFEGERAGPYIVRFAILLFLSTLIAANGVIEDSTATVIGAMIIAPLMTPILATTAALVMGDGGRAWRSFLLVLTGSLAVVGLAALLGSIGVYVIDFERNSQIMGRVAPRLVDLLVALAAGTAGAFATSRADVADSLPGVAVSIALVPPLCVVGISVSGGEWADAGGALLLFLTNFLAILLAGGALFAFLGLGVAAAGTHAHLKRGRAYRIIAVGFLLVAVPLTMTTRRVFRDSMAQATIAKITGEWVHDHPSDFVVSSVLVSGDRAKIVVTGAERPAAIDDLVAEIQSEVGHVTGISLRYIPSRDYRYP
jgi:uncharacterized hydrophobic protein (TIGR00271 family)